MQLLKLYFCLVLCLINFSAYASESTIPFKQEHLSRLQGRWYDIKTNKLVLDIRRNTINGNLITESSGVIINDGPSESKGKYYFFDRSRKKWYYDLKYRIHDGDVWLKFNGRGLKKIVENRRWYESIQGVHLGMFKHEVIEAIGMPKLKPVISNTSEKWNFGGLVVSFYADRVWYIRIPSFSSVKLDRSGLGTSTTDRKIFHDYYGSDYVRHYIIKLPYYDELLIMPGYDEDVPFDICLCIYS